VLVNVTYSYAIVVTAAKSVQETQQWHEENKIQNLVFSNKWVKNFLSRGGVSRRKITTEDKVVPTDEEIKKILKIGQDMYVAGGHEPHTCYNFDETGLSYAEGPSHIWCPGNQRRAINIGISNTKSRITAVIAVNGVGEFAPLMLIIKHSQSSEAKPDQTKMKVITELFKKEGFRAEDGWVKDIWEKSLTVKGVNALHRCTYIRHTVTGHVITSQCKAWNDTTRMVMWFELVMRPIKVEKTKLMIWCDNCGSHKTSSVKDVITETGIDVAFLPPNMTGELQVLDLVVNGPIKAHVKNKRANRLYESFQLYKKERLTDMELPREQRKNPDFTPPKPTMLEGMKDLILLFQEQFTEEKFKQCINRSFIKTGTIPQESGDHSVQPSFNMYSKISSSGTLAVIPQGTFEIESESVTDEYSAAIQEEDFERALFARYIESINRVEEEEEQEQEESNESDSENSY
jgi:DDE superfamily endonuclease